MAFTPEGLQRIAEILAGESNDSLVGGTVEVSDGTRAASKPIEDLQVTSRAKSVRITASASFDEEAANHEWRIRSVVTKQGVVLDKEQSDGGRKVRGSVWHIEVDLDLLLATT